MFEKVNFGLQDINSVKRTKTLKNSREALKEGCGLYAIASDTTEKPGEEEHSLAKSKRKRVLNLTLEEPNSFWNKVPGI